MQLPRLFASGLWLGVTATATAVVWTATSIVAADVTDRPAPVVAHSDVVSQLASGSAGGPGPTTTAPKAADTSTVTPRRTPVPGVTSPSTPRTSIPSSTTTSSPPTTVKTSPTVPPTTSTTQASPETATYSTAGGVVGVACTGFLITLRFAIPNNGFTAVVVAQGPANVDVRFVGPGQSQAVQAVCFGHPIRYDGAIPTR